jgi:hypothetical protein
MSFQKYCESIDDDQVVTAQETMLFTYTNSKSEAFNISPDDVLKFLHFLSHNFNLALRVWEDEPKKKDLFNNYEEKSYRAIYKLADTEELKTISSAGKSQTKALTKLIAKVICYLTGQDFVSVELDTFFDLKSISTAIGSWHNIANSNDSITNDRNQDDIRNKFHSWIINNGLSEKTAKSYSNTGMTLADKYIDKIDYFKESLYLATYEEIIEALTSLKNVDEWITADKNGNAMYSAALKKFSEYLKSVTIRFERISKPFLLLAGISGTGKTRFVREQAKATGNLAETYCLVPVRPDWHEPSDLLGYISRLSGSEYIVTDVLKFLVQAWLEIIKSRASLIGTSVQGEQAQLNAIRPYWLCLDEMNLAPVEQYFSDYLSVLETRVWSWENQTYSYTCDPILKSDVINGLSEVGKSKLRNDLGLADNEELWQYFINYGISIPLNLIVAGTVNMDETTHSFSRKVIDRALSFDFGEFFPNDYSEFFNPKTTAKPLSFPIYSQCDDRAMLAGTCDTSGKKSIEFLNAVNAVLDNTSFKLAYRALNELLLSVVVNQPNDDVALQAVWDDFLMCKVLPRIEGDTDKLANIDMQDSILTSLEQVLSVQLKDIWENEKRPDLYRKNTESDDVVKIPCRSKAKLSWMNSRLSIGFTSFWP